MNTEHVTLTDEERATLLCDCDITDSPEYCPLHTTSALGLDFDLSTPARFIEEAVERILAAREKALREEIARELLAKAEDSAAVSQDPKQYALDRAFAIASRTALEDAARIALRRTE